METRFDPGLSQTRLFKGRHRDLLLAYIVDDVDETSSETIIWKDLEDHEKEQLVHTSDSIEEMNDVQEDHSNDPKRSSSTNRSTDKNHRCIEGI